MNRVWMCAPRGGGTRNYLPRVGFELGSKRNLRRFVEDAGRTELAASRVGTNGRRAARGGPGWDATGEVGEWDGWIGRRNQLSRVGLGGSVDGLGTDRSGARVVYGSKLPTTFLVCLEHLQPQNALD
jgi:hypothetical protein